MFKSLTKKQLSYFTVGSFGLLFLAMFYSTFLMSLSQIFICVAALVTFLKTKETVKGRQKTIILLGLLLIIIPLLGGLYSSDMTYLAERLRIKLPYVLLPISFIALPNLSRKQIINLLKVFVLIALYSVCYVSINYYLNITEIQERLIYGGHMPTPVNHIRYSLLVVIAAVISFYLFQVEQGKLKWLYLFVSIFIVAFIHFLSVRTGIISLYAAIGVYLILELLSKKSIKLLLVFPFFAFLIYVFSLTMPSFSTKMGYTYWEFVELIGNSDRSTSLGNRFKSYDCGLDIINENLLLGVGTGDLKAEVKQCWQEKYPNELNVLMPHNQFLSWAGAHGIPLAILLFAICLSPMFLNEIRLSPVMMAVMMVTLVSFLFENTLENSLGVAIHSFFGMFFIRYFKEISV